MIEIRKYIPQVYNESPDFSVFMGIIQIALNELDVKSLSLKTLPNENLLLWDLVNYSVLKDSFRTLLKNKGKIDSILYAVSLAGGEVITFEEEATKLGTEVPVSRFISQKNSVDASIKNQLVYYIEDKKLYINIKNSLSLVNQDLLTALWHYIKPSNIVIILKEKVTPTETTDN